MKYGSDITLTAAGGTFNITPEFPESNAYRVVTSGSISLAAGVVIQLDPAYTPTKWDTYILSWESTVNLNGQTVTVFGTLLTLTQAASKGIIYCQYDGSAWVVRVFLTNTTKDTGIGAATRVTLTNAGGTLNLDPDKNTPVYSIVGSPTLTSSYTVAAVGSPKSGDMFVIYYSATATVGVNTVTILGKALTAAQALAGNCTVIANYDGTAWQTAFIEVVPVPVWEVGTGVLSAQTVGTLCNASGDYSVASGSGTTASGDNSHSEGQDSTASGLSSHAEGNTTTASGDYAHAEGAGTVASGDYSHAEGKGSIAKAIYSSARGDGAVAHLYASSAFSDGRFTIDGDCEELKLYVKKVTSDATPANMLLGDNATTGIEIPTDCIIDFECRYSALQTAGAGGTIGDCVKQKITFSVQNLAGTLTLLTQGIATTATIVTKASNIIYYEQAKIGALVASCIPTISGTKVLFVVTGEATKNVQHSCLVSMNINGFGNFSI